MSFFSNIFKTAQKKSNNNKSFSKRSLCMEPLEDRQMLSVTPITGGTFTENDFSAIKSAHPELSLGNWADYTGTTGTTGNILVVDAGTINVSSLASQLGSYISISGNDIVIFDTGTTDSTANLPGTLDIPNANGSITFLTIGEGSLTLKGATNQRILNITDSDVQIAGIILEGTGTVSGNGGAISFVDSEAFVENNNNNNNTLTLSNVILKDNKVTEEGGAIYQNKGTSKLYNVLLVGNTAGDGGAIAVAGLTPQTYITNATFVGNNASGTIAGVYAHTSSAATINIQNSIFQNAANKKDVSYSNNGVRIFSNNLYSYAGTITELPPSNTTTEYTIQSNNEQGEAHLDANYRPTIESVLVIDKGSNSAVSNLSLDLAGAPRIDGGIVDRGAYESQTETFEGVVTTLDDVIDKYDGLISLREALAAANNDNNVITFDASLFADLEEGEQAKITLSLGELVVDKALTIEGPGADILAIDANQESRVFRISNNVSLTGLTVTGGLVEATETEATEETPLEIILAYGGGILVDSGELTIADSVISGNTASSGGGISTSNTLTITNSTISENTVSHDGGGIYSSGTNSVLTVMNSVISGNTASRSNGGNGGGIYRDSSGNNSSLIIANSVITGNTAHSNGGGIRNSSKTSIITNSTIAGNTGGGIYSGGTNATTINNSIIAQNTSSDISKSTASGLTVQGFNNLTSFSAWDGESDNNFVYDAELPLFVGELEDGTYDYHLAEYSQAIDKGDDSLISAGITTDIAGNARIQGNAVDIGAYESEYTAVPPTAENVNFAVAEKGLTADSVTLVWEPQAEGIDLSRYVVYYKEQSAEEWASVEIVSTETTATIADLASSQSYDFKLEIIGYGGTAETEIITALTLPETPVLDYTPTDTSITLTWAGQERLLLYTLEYKVSPDKWEVVTLGKTATTFTWDKLTPLTEYEFRLGASNGTDIVYSEKLTVTTELTSLVVTTVEDQHDENPFDNGLSLREAIELVTIENEWNTTGLKDITFDAGLFTDETASIQLTDELPAITTSLTINGTDVTLVAAEDKRILTIDASGEDVAISGLTFANGYMLAHGGYGGAIYQIDGNVTLTDVAFENNAGKLGGAYFQKAGTSEFINATFTGNRSNYGGAIYLYSGTSTFRDNESGQTTFANNTAKWGGAIYLHDGTVNLHDVTLADNKATWGGAIYQLSGTLDATGGISLLRNEAQWGGGLYVTGGSVELTVLDFEAPATTTRFGTAIATKSVGTRMTINGHDAALIKYLDDFSEFIIDDVVFAT